MNPIILDLFFQTLSTNLELFLLPQCDEKFPSCSYCIKREIQCSISTTTTTKSTSPNLQNPLISTSTSASSTTSSPQTTYNTTYHQDQTFYQPPTKVLIDYNTEISLTPQLIELKLIHHYSTTTFISFRNLINCTDIEFWQFQLPQEAFNHPYLLNVLLSTTCLHMSYLGKSTKSGTNGKDKSEDCGINWTKLALNYQKLAFDGYKSGLDNLKKSSGEGLFICSFMLFVLLSGFFSLELENPPKPQAQSQASPSSNSNSRLESEDGDITMIEEPISPILQKEQETMEWLLHARGLLKGVSTVVEIFGKETIFEGRLNFIVPKENRNPVFEQSHWMARVEEQRYNPGRALDSEGSFWYFPPLIINL